MAKLTAVIIAYNRPGYLLQCKQNLWDCYEFYAHIDRVFFSVDDSKGQGVRCMNLVRDFQKVWNIPPAKSNPVVCTFGRIGKKGIVGNTILGMKDAFDNGAEAVIMIEDDAVLKRDALLLAKWFCHQDTPNVVAFGLSAHGERGPSGDFQSLMSREFPHAVAEYNLLPCPFAYVVKREMWPFLLKNWCRKDYHPAGWSWSMTFAARLEGYKFMAPWLSRAENIGREGGTNESPESWDRTQTNILFSDGSYSGPYSVVRTISDEEARRIDDWMEPEIAKDPDKIWKSGDRWPGWLGFGCPPEVEEARRLLS